MPDGDVFGEKIDGTWREAAALLEQGAEAEDVEQAAIKALRRWLRHWLPNGLDALRPFIEILLQYDVEKDSATQRAQASQGLDRLARESFGNKIIATAAKRLLATPQTWHGLTPFLEQRLYRDTASEAVRCGFLEPALAGAEKRGFWTPTEARAWRSRLDAFAARVTDRLDGRVSPQRKQPRTAPPKSKPGTAALVKEALPLGGAVWPRTRSGQN